jgi:hypothetical protein
MARQRGAELLWRDAVHGQQDVFDVDPPRARGVGRDFQVGRGQRGLEHQAVVLAFG